jgi:hypothetical protein
VVANVVAVPVAVADSEELRVARVVRRHAGMVRVGLVVRQAHQPADASCLTKAEMMS